MEDLLRYKYGEQFMRSRNLTSAEIEQRRVFEYYHPSTADATDKEEYVR
jgi:hypothetical protein